jgi:FkbM family methyltransferase
MANGMRGATENLHVGLSEFEDMAFVLHLLRQTDLFVDVGANVGAYTVLASGVAGSMSIAFEPVPDTFTHLLRNIAVNAIADRVDGRNVAVGREDGTVRFTATLDTINHVATEHDTADQLVEVPVVKLDHALENREPTLIKIDVEGYEAQDTRERFVGEALEPVLHDHFVKAAIVNAVSLPALIRLEDHRQQRWSA